MKNSGLLKPGIFVIFILLVLIVYQYGFAGYRAELGTLRETVDMRAQTLERYLSFISKKPLLEKKITALKKERLAREPKLFSGPTPSLASASLQETVKGIIMEAGGTITRETVNKYEAEGNLYRITVSIDAMLTDPGTLGNILYSIETHTPYMAVESLDAQVRNTSKPEELFIKMDVSALSGRT